MIRMLFTGLLVAFLLIMIIPYALTFFAPFADSYINSGQIDPLSHAFLEFLGPILIGSGIIGGYFYFRGF